MGDRLIATVAFLVAPIAFGAMGMWACYLDTQYHSPVAGLVVGAAAGFGVAWFAIPLSRPRA